LRYNFYFKFNLYFYLTIFSIIIFFNLLNQSHHSETFIQIIPSFHTIVNIDFEENENMNLSGLEGEVCVVYFNVVFGLGYGFGRVNLL